MITLGCCSLQARWSCYSWYGINRTTFQPIKKKKEKKIDREGKERKKKEMKKKRGDEGLGTIAPEPKVYAHINKISKIQKVM